MGKEAGCVLSKLGMLGRSLGKLALAILALMRKQPWCMDENRDYRESRADHV